MCLGSDETLHILVAGSQSRLWDTQPLLMIARPAITLAGFKRKKNKEYVFLKSKKQTHKQTSSIFILTRPKIMFEPFWKCTETLFLATKMWSRVDCHPAWPVLSAAAPQFKQSCTKQLCEVQPPLKSSFHLLFIQTRCLWPHPLCSPG